jgi:hypothetical protein
MCDINIYYRDKKGESHFLFFINDAETTAEAVAKAKEFLMEDDVIRNKIEFLLSEEFNFAKLYGNYQDAEDELRKLHNDLYPKN